METRPRRAMGWHWAVESTLVAVSVLLVQQMTLRQGLWDAWAVEAVWPSTGVAIGCLMLLGRSRAVGVGVGSLLAMLIALPTGQLGHAVPWPTTILISSAKAVSDTVEALLAVTLIRVWCKDQVPIYRLSDALKFALVAGGLAPAVGASMGLPLMILAQLTPASEVGESLLMWCLSPLVGTWIIAPLMLALFDAREVRETRRQAVHMLAIAGLIIFVGLIAFTPLLQTAIIGGEVMVGLWLPLIVWAALALGQPGAMGACFLATTIAVAGAGSDFGPFRAETVARTLLNLQIHLASLALTGLLVGAIATEHRRDRQALRDHRDRLRRMARELAAAEHRRQRALAEQLHDGLGQELAMAKLRLSEAVEQTASPGGSRLHDALGMLDKAIDATRGITFELSPPSLRSLGLPAALRSMGDNLEQRHGLIFEYTQTGPDRRLPDEMEAMLFRIARELATNAVKHARATHLGIDVDFDPGSVTLCVWDDGVGFDAATTPVGFGLLSIRETVEGLGGTMRLDRQGRRTVATVSLPLDNDPPATTPGPPHEAATR